MKIRTMLIITMIVFSLFSMIMFTVFVGVHLSSSSDSRYKQTMREMSVKQSGALLHYFDSYIQRFNIIAGNPAVADFIDYLESLEESEDYGDDYDNDSYDDEDEEYESSEYSPERLRVRSALEAFIHGDSGITGITIFDEENAVIITIGGDLREFLMSARREELRENQFAVIPLPADANADNNFELLQYARIGDSPFFMICTYSSSDITEFFNHSKLSSRGKVILICPLNNLLDNNYRGNLDEASQSQEYIRIKIFLQEEKFRNGTEIFSFEVGREESHALFNGVGDTGWLLGVVGRTTDIKANSGASVSMITNLAVFLGLAIVGLSIFFVIIFTKPLAVIKDVIARIRRGDHEVRIDVSQSNEFGKMAKEFNELLD
ncbi:MAG: HAMP domain-containing protein, partial [Oscillospiraceae bacterium]|nr:HAMP domain-containing protein [Oscillospiraceae bacterium]